MRWLVLGGRANGLGVARALNNPSNVYVLDICERKPVTACSRYVKEIFLIDRTYPSVASFLDRFLSVEAAILIATDDWWVYQISKYQESASGKFYGFFPGIKECDNFLDKTKLYSILKIDVDIPAIVNPVDIKSFEGFIVKPRLSFDEKGVIEKGINSWKKYHALGVDVLVQEHIPAPIMSHLSVCGIIINGKIICPFFSRKVMEYPSPMGTATMIQNVTDQLLRDELLKCAKKTLLKLDYTGIFEVEFIESQGKYWCIDFNPRFWLQHEMASLIGINYARIYSELSLNPNQMKFLDLMPNYSKRVVWIHEGAFISFINARNKLKIISILISSKISFAHFKLNDLGPFWCFLKCKLKL